MAPKPAPTPGPVALNPSPAFDERDQIVTVLSTAAAATSSSSASSSSSTTSLIGPIVGGLVGGIAAGLLIAGIWYYCARKSQREKEEARIRYQRRKARRQQQQARPSASSSRQTSTTKLALQEKEYAPSSGPLTPVSGIPIMPKNVYDPYKVEQGYGYPTSAPTHSPNGYQYDQNQQYAVYDAKSNVAYDENQYPQYDNNNNYAHGEIANEPAAATVPAPQEKKSSKSSRSEKRVAAAEQAAASANAPISERHRPNKPSPLALAGQQNRDEAPKWGEGPFRSPTNPISPSNYGDAQETLADERDRYLSASNNPSSGNDGRVTSGEWGVALGSPNHDGSFADQQQVSDNGHDHSGRRPFAADPYLTAASNGSRGTSGQYTSDPYASYHDDSKAKKSWI